MPRKISSSPDEQLDMRQEVGSRLEAERARLGITQDHMAMHAGVTRRTYAYYAAGLRDIDGMMLNNLSLAGVDIVFVLTGKKQPDTLSPQEVKMIEDARRMHPSMLAMFQTIMHAVSISPHTGEETGSSSNYIHGDNATVGQHFQGSHQNFAPLTMHVGQRPSSGSAAGGEKKERKSKNTKLDKKEK